MQVTVGAKCWDGARRKTIVRNADADVSFERLSTEIDKRTRTHFDPKLKALLSYAVPLILLSGGLPPFGITRAFAATPAAVPAMVISTATKSKILHAFDPLIDLVQSLSYPIAGVMIAGGCLFIMVGNRERGMQMLQNAAIGYILVQLSPMLLQLLVGIGGTV